MSVTLVLDTVQLTLLLLSAFVPAGILIGYVNSKVKELQLRVRKLEKLTELMDDANARVEEDFKMQGVRQ